MTIWALDVAAAVDVIPESLPLLHLTHQEKIDVIAGKVIIEWTCQFLPRAGRGTAGATIWGVTTTIKSVSADWNSFLPNRGPRTGTEPIQGSCEMLRRLFSCSRPAIEKLWPSRSSTVVRASRLLIDGMTK